MKMHQMATKIGGIVRGVFTDTIIFEGKINKPKCNEDIIGGIRETAIKDFTKCIHTTLRESKYIEECPKPTKLTQIKEFKLDDNNGCFITGEPGTGKTYMCKKLQQEILNSIESGNSFRVCTPTHKSALNANATTIYNLFNIVDGCLSEDSLKSAKQIVLKIHPDKSQLDSKYFLFFSKAYKRLYSIYEFQNKSTNKQYKDEDFYDESLGDKLGITLIATGFEHKDPFKKEAIKEVEAPIEEKIVMTLQSEQTEQSTLQEAPSAPIESAEINEPTAIETELPEAALTLDEVEITMDELAPTMQEFEMPEMSNVYVSAPDYEEEEEEAVSFESSPIFEEEIISQEIVLEDFNEAFEEEEAAEVFELNMEEESTPVYNTEFVLNKPVNIYAEAELEIEAEAEEVEAVVESVTEVAYDITAEVVVAADTENLETSFRSVEMEMEEEPTMQLVMREESSVSPQNRPQHSSFDISMDNSEEQRRKVAERIQKLRNLSFNINNGADPGVEFDAVPAYVRRNLDLFGNTMASVENYYSKYTVEQDENNQTQISTINSFLDGKKPD